MTVADAYLFLHGTTIGINTLLERTGAQTALLVTRGFVPYRSLRHMRRGRCPDLAGWRHLYGKGSYCMG